MVIIEPLSSSAVLHVALRMRAADRREISAVRWSLDAGRIAGEVWALSRFGCVARAGGVPVAVVMAGECWPGFYAVGMFATDDWPKVALATTRWVKQTMIPAMMAAGAHRAECRSMADHHEAHRWLERLGAVREAYLPDCGKNREPFVLFAWRLSDPPPEAVRTAGRKP